MLLGHESCRCLPGERITQQTTQEVALDQDTGRLTVERFVIEYPAHRSRFDLWGSVHHVWGPTISSDGLGCAIDALSRYPIWMQGTRWLMPSHSTSLSQNSQLHVSGSATGLPYLLPQMRSPSPRLKEFTTTTPDVSPLGTKSED